MELRLALVSLLIICLISDEIEAKRSSSGGSRRGSGGYGAKPRTTQRPPVSQTRAPQNSGASQPVGWNVNNKPSAPEHTASKATAVHTQSGNPYGQQHSSNPYYPAGGTHQSGYNPSGGYHPQGGYNPSGGYHPQGGYNPQGGGYHPSGYNPSHYPQNHGQSHGLPYQPYQPPQGGYSSPGHGYNPSVGTPIIVQGSSKPGIGQIAKEAFVYAGVSAGVNAAVNRIIPGGIYGHSGGSSSQVSPSGVVPTNTQITYNNYYNGSAPAPVADGSTTQNQNPPQPAVPLAQSQTPAANSNAPAANNSPPAADSPSPSNQNSNSQNVGINSPPPEEFPTAAHDIQQLTEDLFKKDTNNANHLITVNLQGQKKDDSTNDDAPEHLLSVKSEAYEIPTVKAVLALHDNYELSVKTKETVTPDERNEESNLLDEFLKTSVLQTAMKFLADKGYIPKDEYEFKDVLKAIWFSQFKRIEGDSSSSGFETVYLAEQFDNEIIGLHNWIYFAKQEEANNLNYLGYIQEKKLASMASIIKLRSTLNNVLQPVTSIFVGTSPELEMALYTICFYTRPNNLCPISLGGSQFSIIVNRVNYFGKEILVSAYPEI